MNLTGGLAKCCVASISQSKTLDCSFLTFFFYYIIVLLEKSATQPKFFCPPFQTALSFTFVRFLFVHVVSKLPFRFGTWGYVCLYVDELSLKMCVNRSLKWLVRNRDCTFNIIKISNINTVSTRQCLQIFRH